MKLNKNLLASVFALDRGGKDHLLFIQGMRGFAMLIIFVGHNWTNLTAYIPEGSFTTKSHSFSYTTMPTVVDLFFLISGFLMYRSLLHKPRPYFSYLLQRIRRIYPAFLVVFLVYIGLSFLYPPVSKIPVELKAAVLYLLENLLLLPGVFNITPLISVAWFLSYEMFWVIVLPLLIDLLHLRSWRPAQRTAFFLTITTAGLLLFTRFGGPIRLVSFIAGFVLVDFLAFGKVKSLPKGTGLVTIPLLLVAIVLCPVDLTGLAAREAVIFIGLSIICLDCFISPNGLTAKAFSWKPFCWWGTISYSYFLTHGLVCRIYGAAIPMIIPPTGSNVWVYWVSPLVTFIPTIAVGLGLFFLVELPFSFGGTIQPKAVTETAATRASE
jgi:exopolysaccharide production protein ExoZ